ncbi:MAG: tetratricopeptide repeat protein [Gemmatimonadales bacterium]
MFVLELLGTLSLSSDKGPIPIAAKQKRPLSLLAILALGGRQGTSRQRVEVYLWPESNAPRARHALDQAVYAIRRNLGGEVIIAIGQELKLNPELVTVDVWQFDDAIHDRQWAVAAGLWKGIPLDGFSFGESCELETRIDAERARVLLEYQTAMEFLADLAARDGDHSQDVTWRRRLASSDPLSAGRTKKLMLALAAAGDRAAAVKQARLYQTLVREELEMEPDGEIERMVGTLSRPSTTESGSVDSLSSKREVIARPIIEAAPSGLLQIEPVRAASGDKSVHAKPWMARSRTVGFASVSIIAVLLIGAMTVRNGQSAHRAASADASAAAGTRGVSRTPVPAARDAYLLGIKAWEDRTPEGHDKAVVLFRRATDLDPGYAEAYAELAEAYVRIGYFGYRPADAMFPKAKAAALRSIELDSTLATSRTALATDLIWEHDFAGAEREYRKAIALDPANATAHQWYGVLLMILGRVPESVAEEKRAADLEPLSLQIQNNYATFVNISGDHAGALRHFRKTIGEEPDSAWTRRNPWVLANMARTYADNGKHAEAMRMINRALEIVPRNPRALHTLSGVYLAAGDREAAGRAFASADTSNEQYPAYRGLVFADLGKVDSAFIWFDRQKQWGIQPTLSLQADRSIDSIREEPRFRALLARIGIPVQH